MTHRISVPDDFPRALGGTRAEEKLMTLGEVRLYSDKAKDPQELVKRLKGLMWPSTSGLTATSPAKFLDAAQISG